MAFATISQTPGVTIEQFRAVQAVLGDRPEGLLAQIVGVADSKLQIITVWESRAHNDRFVAEQLHPAFNNAGYVAEHETVKVEFEVAELTLADSTTAR
jgi:hypothetical protein